HGRHVLELARSDHPQRRMKTKTHFFILSIRNAFVMEPAPATRQCHSGKARLRSSAPTMTRFSRMPPTTVSAHL
ncbi:MAG TPA: hypothetical protein VFP14_07140, partial [Novosphingobium sp.]|nr:hypothetical protein [Novosphingobium sp.]